MVPYALRFDGGVRQVLVESVDHFILYGLRFNVVRRLKVCSESGLDITGRQIKRIQHIEYDCTKRGGKSYIVVEESTGQTVRGDEPWRTPRSAVSSAKEYIKSKGQSFEEMHKVVRKLQDEHKKNNVRCAGMFVEGRLISIDSDNFAKLTQELKQSRRKEMSQIASQLFQPMVLRRICWQ